MFDGSLIEETEGGGFVTCPQCLNPFVPRRRDMRFCCPTCRKAFSRPIQNARHSRAKARKNAVFFDTARRLGERMYSLPPTERLGFMQQLVEEARQGNTQLRELLSNWKLRHPHPENDSWMFPRGSRAYSTIAQAAQAYCWQFWKANVDDVVYCRVPEPPTGEVG